MCSSPFLEVMRDLNASWIHNTPMVPDAAPYAFDAILDASDEFDASPFVAIHGWYRQATAGLRNALELMATGSYVTLTRNQDDFERWRAGDFEPSFWADDRAYSGRPPSE